MKRKIRTYSGSSTPEVTRRESENRKLARTAAAEGIVLLKNEDVLPIKEGQKVAIYGNGASHLIKGGTGSGDVNEREVVSIQCGLTSAGVTLTNQKTALAAPEKYEEAKLAWRNQMLELMNEVGAGSDMAFFDAVDKHPFEAPELTPIVAEEAKLANLILYCISRIAGEGRDREAKEGDYYPSPKEKEELAALASLNDNIVVLINAGGQIDLTEIHQNKSVKAILNISQGGMEAGNAVADVLTGKVVPSGKLTSTWTVRYEDYPNSSTFSHNNGDTETELYTEGIYVGYRYFDSFEVETAYPFGFGLSYTGFEITPLKVEADAQAIHTFVKITNIGKEYSGKEVVQVYAALPQSGMQKEFKRLIGFGKTNVLSPGETQTMQISVPAKSVASFSEEQGMWIIEQGQYGILAGNSSENVKMAGILEVEKAVAMERTDHICPLKEELSEILPPIKRMQERERDWRKAAAEASLKVISFAPAAEVMDKIQENELDERAKRIAEELTDDEIIAMLMGEITKGQDNLKEDELVETGIYVPGAAGETSCALEKKYDVPGISMADGPAGIRVMRHYDVDRASGKIYSQGLLAAIEGGVFALDHKHENADTYYMYATAIPIGTGLAQTWNPAMLEQVGAMIGGEMREFGISWWLAPGMNIHRNPLCGRNFEYYSEDPVVAGVMAAAITRGVQSVPGVGTVIKHFVCNNQEDNRMGSNSVLSERSLREIYLKGFEIAVKTAQPMCIMTSYNKVNGLHTANSIDLNTVVARKEWDFQGIIMTDWTTTTEGGSSSHGCAVAGNDLIMPGNPMDLEDIKKALAAGTLSRDCARACCVRLFKVIFQTIGMENPEAYNKQFDLLSYIILK